ncbi:hypothetical protein DLAC_11451 [Tieghemostelium lacteum]|uniref:Uncharacterized protein n=1 Tax=Tieghemostelium lacteum TaxID=361077 RepID=A0A152A730_TIELA|nr:hypothetical protein DLAC_11451 [Tieghemostelium lacteum]|eukprot:KYR02042.1 hypothetical protein DLAC_11451 [Tieghemostelium lacteum]
MQCNMQTLVVDAVRKLSVTSIREILQFFSIETKRSCNKKNMIQIITELINIEAIKWVLSLEPKYNAKGGDCQQLTRWMSETSIRNALMRLSNKMLLVLVNLCDAKKSLYETREILLNFIEVEIMIHGVTNTLSKLEQSYLSRICKDIRIPVTQDIQLIISKLFSTFQTDEEKGTDDNDNCEDDIDENENEEDDEEEEEEEEPILTPNTLKVPLSKIKKEYSTPEKISENIQQQQEEVIEKRPDPSYIDPKTQSSNLTTMVQSTVQYNSNDNIRSTASSSEPNTNKRKAEEMNNEIEIGQSSKQIQVQSNTNIRVWNSTYHCHFCEKDIHLAAILQHSAKCYYQKVISLGLEPFCTCPEHKGLYPHSVGPIYIPNHSNAKSTDIQQISQNNSVNRNGKSSKYQ